MCKLCQLSDNLFLGVEFRRPAPTLQCHLHKSVSVKGQTKGKFLSEQGGLYSPLKFLHVGPLSAF